MLDEEEFAEVARLHSEAMQNTKHFVRPQLPI